MKKNIRILFFIIVLCGTFPLAVQASMENVYTDVRFQLYNHDNHFTGELITGQASATKLDRQDPRIDLDNGVVIELFDTDFTVTGDKKPPLKVKITSDRGTFMQAQNKETKEFQQIVVLDGNVVVTRYKPKDTLSGEQEVDSVVTCDKARWNHNTGILNGYGLVVMKRADNSMLLSGRGMVYEVNPEKKLDFSVDQQEQELSGVLEITSDVEFVVNQRNSAGRIDKNNRIKVTCEGIGRYDFDNTEMYFSDKVKVVRANMLIESDFLRVVLAQDAGRRKFEEMVAWCIEDRVVNITGSGDPRNMESKIGNWSAQAEYARYIEQTGEMLLTDERDGMLPLAQMDEVVIQDNTISFYVKEERFYATGTDGIARLKAGLDDYDGAAQGESPETIVRFNENLLFDQLKNVAQFTGNVRLVSSGLELDTDRLLIDFVGQAIGESKASSVKKATALGSVKLTYQSKKATCEKLEITPNLQQRSRPDNKGRLLLDNFVLSGTPMPEVEVASGGFFQAKKISINRYKIVSTGERTIYINATGPGSGSISSEEVSGQDKLQQLSTIIRFSTKMLYDELDDRIDLYGEVTASNNDQVLSSDRLLITLASVAGTGSDAESNKQITRLTAVGNANMHWGTQHCEADKVDRQIKANGKGQVILVGTKTKHAKIWEESGAAFQGPWIKAADDGSWIYSSGGGELSMLDRDTNEKAMVIYSGDAYYTTKGRDSQAIFSDNVILRRGNMKVTGDKMKAELVSTQGEGNNELISEAEQGGISTSTLPKRLKRVTIEGNVIVRQGKRVAFGNKGQVDIGEKGDIMLLAGTADVPAEVNDNNGFSLRAPKIMIKETAGIVTASGPGEVKLVGGAAAAEAGFDSSLVNTASTGTYSLYYTGRIIYNQLLKKIRFEKNVRMVQDTLRGRCDLLTVYLNKAPEGLEGTQGDEPIIVENIETYGNVRFESYPEPFAGRDPTNLPGRTVYTRSQEAHYDATHNVILLTGKDRPAEILFQELNGGNRMRYLQKADRIWYNTKTKEIKVTGSNQQSMPLPPTGPLRFPD